MKTEKSNPKDVSPAISTYLIAYNSLQTIGWSLIGLIIGQHLLGGTPQLTLYEASKTFLQIFQTAAILEVLHCIVGFVRSNPVLTAFQVASRVFVVWGILHSVENTQASVGYTLLLAAWTITEIIRYLYYVLNIAKIEAYPLVWLRYTLFIILYPIGVTGELTCIYQALPQVAQTGLYSIKLPNKMNFAFDYQYVLVLIMLSYIPIFPQLYLHMFAQRKKIIGGAAKPKPE